MNVSTTQSECEYATHGTVMYFTIARLLTDAYVPEARVAVRTLKATTYESVSDLALVK